MMRQEEGRGSRCKLNGLERCLVSCTGREEKLEGDGCQLKASEGHFWLTKGS